MHSYASTFKDSTKRTFYPRESTCFNPFIRENHLQICKFIRKDVLSFTIEDSPQNFYKISDYSTETLVKPIVNLKIRELLELLKASDKHVTPDFRLKKIPEPNFFEEKQPLRKSNSYDKKIGDKSRGVAPFEI